MENQILSKPEILDQLSRILRSQVFRNSDMLRNFLSFIVQEALKENGIVLKQYSIAIHAFGRNPDFDATSDPIVRIQASRLRRNLDQYYQEEGGEDEIFISLPKGTYIPQFSFSKNRKKFGISLARRSVENLNSIAVFPLKNLSADHDKQYIIEGFSEELVMELSRYKHLQVIRVNDMIDEPTRNSIARFSLEGSIRYSGNTIKISIGALDNHNQDLFWSYQEKFNIDACDLIEIQEEVASAVANQIAGMNGVVSEKLYAESNWENTHNPSAYTTYLHFYKYTKDPNPENASELLEKVTQVVEKEPGFAPGWAVLTRLFTDAYIFSLNQELLDKALSYGKKSVELQANHQACQAYYSYSLMVSNRIEESMKHCKIALSLNPNSIHYSGAIGFLYCLMDQTEKGFHLIRKSIEVDFQYPKWFHVGTFLYFLDKKDYHNALIEANGFDKRVYWSSLLQLVACHLLQQNQQAMDHLHEIMKIKPDFFDHPREYVRCLVKSENAVAVILDALDEVIRSSESSFSSR